MPANLRPRIQPRIGARGLCCAALFWLALCVAAALRAPAATPREAAPSPLPDAPDESRRSGHPGPDAPGPGAQYVGSGLCGSPAFHVAMMADFNALRHSHYVSDP